MHFSLFINPTTRSRSVLWRHRPVWQDGATHGYIQPEIDEVPERRRGEDHSIQHGAHRVPRFTALPG